MHVAASDGTVKELDQLMEIAQKFNQPCGYLNNNEAQRMCPWLKTDEALRS